MKPNGFECAMKMMYDFDYKKSISFPLGGIGAGSIGLAGNGALVDWEISNRPNRESMNPFSFFAIKAQKGDTVIDDRVLQGGQCDDFMGGKYSGNQSWGYGHGPNRATMCGIRHFEQSRFEGEFPFATVRFQDRAFPAAVTMTAYNPFIPSNEDDSSLPCAMFEIDIHNTQRDTLRYTVALCASNPLKDWGGHRFCQSGSVREIVMSSRCGRPRAAEFGSFSMATDCMDGSYQEYWYRGDWFDDITMFLNDFGLPGELKNRTYSKPARGKADISTLAASVEIEPDGHKKVRFILAWYQPNFKKYWQQGRLCKKPMLHNYYARRFQSSSDVIHYCFSHYERLYHETKTFQQALFSSTLPEQVMDAVQGNLATLKTTTCLRLEDGFFWGWEGVNKTAGSCEGTCQHVWNYAYALPFLFPRLEKGVRQKELTYNMEQSGLMHFRMMLPLGSKKHRHRACVDGQMGTVLKCYREWKLSGDTPWLTSHWPKIKRCMEFAWSPKNRDQWDPERSGVITGRQHHTLDVELFVANSWLTGFYHDALLAAAEMARACNDESSARLYGEIYKRGHEALEKDAFNGKYYVQKLDVRDRKILSRYRRAQQYWDGENAQLKYQLGDGCEIDQVVADWHTGLVGLPHVFDQEHRRSALQSIYRLNFKSMAEHSNPCRVFACNDEKGVVMCAWENPGAKPAIPIPYAEECMSGFEYAVACNMLQCGMEKEALDIVSAIRDRYDGKKRNPWAEIECGANYARAMASYSFLLAYSGFQFNLAEKELGFSPLRHGTYFWSVDGAWGTVDYQAKAAAIHFLYGEVELRRILIAQGDTACSVTRNGKKLPAECFSSRIELKAPEKLWKGDVINITLNR